MTGHLVIASPGVHTTVQDLGRTGFLDIGVPPSGALDPFALRLANHLVGNAGHEAGLEILHAGPKFQVEADHVQVAVTGAGAALDVLEPEPGLIPTGRSISLKAGAVFQIGVLKETAVAYLAVRGGLALPPCMGSTSTHTRGGFGGHRGRMLQSGDRLALKDLTGSVREDHGAPSGFFEPVAPISPLRVILGPQEGLFSKAGIETFLTQTFTISTSSDRMGARLDGPALALEDIGGFISDGIIAGAIQVPGSGQPIILMADHQTSGGYPKIATVISADLPLLGRLGPGRQIRFAAVSLAQAVTARRRQEEDFQKLINGIAPIAAPKHVNMESLYSNNLISGVVNANSR